MIRIATICLSVYWLAIFAATHLPSRALPGLQWSDKVYHIIAFSGLAFLLAWALPNRLSRTFPHVVLAALIGLLYACLDEFTQQFIPGRTCDVWDVLADAGGIAIGLAIYWTLRQALSHLSWGRRLIHSLSR